MTKTSTDGAHFAYSVGTSRICLALKKRRKSWPHNGRTKGKYLLCPSPLPCQAHNISYLSHPHEIFIPYPSFFMPSSRYKSDTWYATKGKKTMILLKTCPRCDTGDIEVDKDFYGWRALCLQCGYIKDLSCAEEAQEILASQRQDKRQVLAKTA